MRAALWAGLGVYITLAGDLSARNILQTGGAPSSAQGGSGSGANSAGAAAAAQAGAAARSSLARTTTVLQASQSLQQAARDAARASSKPILINSNRALPVVPNGLVVGGLQVAPGVPVDLANPAMGEDASLWQGAALPKQTVVGARTKVTIKQTEQQAVLNWKTFNIGKNTTLSFDQSAGGSSKSQWTAFNKIADPSGVPSQILGAIEAPGQVYVINPNGILFGGGSQINLHALVASSLPINDNLIGRGLLNNPDAQFLFSALALPAGSNGTPAFTPAAALTADGRYGDVVVQAGAVISTPVTAEHVGGRVALIGANVSNAGTIDTPEGQTILAAGLQVGFGAHASSDPSLRGLDVFVGAVVDPAPMSATYAGTAGNTGLIHAPRANVTMAGKTVNQFGVIDSSTSVSLNGRIDLLANYNAASYPQSSSDAAGVAHAPFLFQATGTVSLGPDSVTRILPDLNDPETVVGTQLALNSQIHMQGQAIHLQDNATVLAPGANVTLGAGVWKYTGGTLPVAPFVYSSGQIYLDSGALIDVAGSAGVSAPMAKNIVSVELRGSELADSPSQRFGIFRGLTIKVDTRQSGIYEGRTWVGTPLADASGYVGLIQRSVGELTTAGGTVDMHAGGSVVMQKGAVVDVSGGWTAYQSGMVETTRVLSQGRIYDISQATPDMVYDGIYTGIFSVDHPKYGLRESYLSPLLLNGLHYEEGYLYGASGGSIAMTAPSMALDGELRGHTINGPRQRTVTAQASAIALNFQAQDPVGPLFTTVSPTPPAITFSEAQQSLTAADAFSLDVDGSARALRSDRQAQVVLSPELLTSSGFGSLMVKNVDGQITVPEDVTLQAPPAGAITLEAANLNIDGQVIAPGGRLSFRVHDISPTLVALLNVDPGASTPAANLSRGHFTLGATGLLSVAGLMVDDRQHLAGVELQPLVTRGGSIAVSSYDMDLAAGSVIDVSGGMSISATGKRFYGDGGSVSLSAGQAAQIEQDAVLAAVVGGRLNMAASLVGYSGAKGSALTILAPQIQVGGAAANPDILLLNQDFFNQGGFSSFTLKGLGGINKSGGGYLPAVSIDSLLAPVVQSAVAIPDETGSGWVLNPVTKPEGIRPPVSLNFVAVGVKDSFTKLPIFRGDLVLGSNGDIHTDALGSISLAGETVRVLGSLSAPGGTISISGGKDSNSVFPDEALALLKALPTVYIGSTARISTAGTTVLTPNARGYRTGNVLAGGTISVTGNIVAEPGAVLDVSGTSGILDMPIAYRPANVGQNAATLGVTGLGAQGSLGSGSLRGAAMAPVVVESNAGTIRLSGGPLLATDATLVGAAGGPSALGGTLTVSSGFFVPAGGSTLQSPLDVKLEVTQNKATHRAGQFVFGSMAKDAAGNALAGSGHIAVNSFGGGGFDAVNLLGTVQFSGPVTMSANRRLTVATGGVIYADSAVELNAPYVALGTPFHAPFSAQESKLPFVQGALPFNFAPSYGAGTLTVNASLIDIGNLSLQNIGVANFVARDGEIRGDGTLNVAGHITLTAAQIYPPTAVSFTIAASDYLVGGANQPGTVTVIGSGQHQLPLSAGGELNIYGSVIEQGGVLRAPLGTIRLGWDGTGSAPINAITGAPVVQTQTLDLGAKSVTSVSAIDPLSGRGAVIPFGLIANGASWIDPTGTDISVAGVPGKAIYLAGNRINAQPGSTVDLRGGGDLSAYRWVPGIGGTEDILASTKSFAVIPGYSSEFAPYAPFSRDAGASNLGGDPGYVNNALAIGDRVYLAANGGLPAGTYTLLPARYALMPGAFLVRPRSGAPVGQAVLADQSTLTPGYRLNSMSATAISAPVMSWFEVASPEVIAARSQYQVFGANQFLADSATKLDAVVPRLPVDAGHLVLQATAAMNLSGSVLAAGAAGGRGGLVDISSSSDILIAGPGRRGAAGVLVLDAKALSGFGAESLLIGGVRQLGPNGASITVYTNNLTVQNPGAALSVPDLILVAKNNLTVAPNAEIVQRGQIAGAADPVFIGNATVAGSGNGAVLRVSSDPTATVSRVGFDSSSSPALVVGAGAHIVGNSVILDSSSAMSIDPGASILGKAITIDSGRISLQLDNPGALQANPGLVLAGPFLQGLQSAQRLSLLSYSSIDLYGTGRFDAAGSLALHAGEIRGFNTGGGTLTFGASSVSLDNSAGSSVLPGVVAASSGTLAIDAGSIRLGAGQLRVDQYRTVDLSASSGVSVAGAGGFSAQGALTVTTPAIRAASAANQLIAAGGALLIQSPSAGTGSVSSGGLGATLTLRGASVSAQSRIVLPSGVLTLHATAGDVTVGDLLDVRGTARDFYGLVKYTDGGEIYLVSDTGAVNIGANSTLDVSAVAGGGDAGSLSVSAPTGVFTLTGTILGNAGAGGVGGSFSLDTGSLPGGSLSGLNATLDAGGFTQSRAVRVRSGNLLIDGDGNAHRFDISADQGSITVTGTLDASGNTGGSIHLSAYGSVVLASGSMLSVAADNFNAAGKGGAVVLEAGSERNGVFDTGALLDLQSGSTIDLGVAAQTGASAWRGQLGGTLHLRAPQTAAGTDLQMAAINSTIISPSKVVVEGYRLYTLSGATGTIDAALQTTVKTNGNTFAGAGGTTTAGYTAMANRLLVNNAGLSSVLSLQPGAEIINRTGDIQLSADWDLSSFRFGPNSAPGVLTMRAAGSLLFVNGGLSDGFTSGAYTAQLLAFNAAQPLNAQSWSYRLAAGADLSAANFTELRPLSALGATAGSLLLGKNGGTNISTGPTIGTGATTAFAVAGHFQVIRTGTGDIEIAAGRDVQLLNQFATIYTAGTRVATPTALFAANDFDMPIVSLLGGQGALGAVQQLVPAQYSYAGGNVVVHAQNDIVHLTKNNAGALIADSSRELPNNWLYRRGYINPATGLFDVGRWGDISSTTWWVDFSNFFEGVGALGGGDVTMRAGRNITNVDAVIPTNARMPKGAPNADQLVELGGGDLSVKAGYDIDGGVYYVERGKGQLSAGHSIHTNSTRSPSLTILKSPAEIDSAVSWLPTSLFLGKGSFDVRARGDVLLGPVANAFLMPAGVNNTFWYKTYFSTYAASDSVDVASLGGSVTLRQSATLAGESGPKPLLQAWLERELLLVGGTTPSASFYQPWLRLAESQVAPFATAVSLMPPTLRATAFTGDINVVGDLTLFPAVRGTLELVAGGGINGLQYDGVTSQIIAGNSVRAWSASTINVSDANPASVPAVWSPFAYRAVVGASASASTNQATVNNFLAAVDGLFAESGATIGAAEVLQTKQALHAPGVLHTGDSEPVRLYAASGDISGLTLFSPKVSRVIAGNDITDVALYLQNTDASDVSVVSAGRDIVLYQPNSPLRVAAQLAGNALAFGEGPLAGDIQISGPGSLEVLAGRDLDLGVGPNNSDGTALGITSIGNSRNPYLPFAGADIVAGAGIGSAASLEQSALDFVGFLAQVDPAAITRYLTEAANTPGRDTTATSTPVDLDALSAEERALVALDIFYRVLRDAGRGYATAGNYDSGFAAIEAVFGETTGGGDGRGDILLTSREIKTRNGGSISLFAPHGDLTVGIDVGGNQALDQGILTEAGGNISIFANGSVNVGTSRIFTLRGGDEILWSSNGDIAAGASSKTVQSAPPTRVVVDAQTADVKTDLAGLATGGGIGVLATVSGLAPGNIDLIAPTGVVDAGDAGIRVSGSLNIAAVQVLNSSNIQAAGGSTGVPSAPVVAAPNLGGFSAGASAAGAANSSASEVSSQARNQPPAEEPPSIITVEVIGYGGGE